MKPKNDGLSEDEARLINAMRKLHVQGIDVVAVDDPEHSKILFPNGINHEEYNNIVPGLVQKGMIDSRYDSPRDGPRICLSKKAKEQLF